MSNTVINPYNFAVADVGAWKEIARTTLGSGGDIIDVINFDDKLYYMVLSSCINSGVIGLRTRVGDTTIDTASNYSRNTSDNGGAYSSAVNQNFIDMAFLDDSQPIFQVNYLANLSAQEKLMTSHTVAGEGSGAATSPFRCQGVGKWANTSSPLQSYRSYNASSGSFATGSEVVVLGYDPTDTHTEADNFWQELASVTLTGTGDTIDSGTITAKKYLWIQGYCKNTGGDIRPTFQFNSDTGSNYANRGSSNGASDTTNTSVDRMYLSDSANQGVPIFFNIFVVNNSANEKLCIAHIIDQGTAGAGNSPNRYESVGKWDNTSSQITSIQVQNDRAGDFNTGSILKVWGSD